MKNRIHSLRLEKNLSMMEAARRLNLPYTTYVNYEKGNREPNSEVLIGLADFFDVSVDYLVGKTDERKPKVLPDNVIPLPATKKRPLYGNIACGEPILAANNIEAMVDVPDDVNADFCLRCKGDSMINARIFDGDIVYIRKQDTVENGQIAAVLVNDEATLKRVRLYDDHIILQPENPECRPFVYWHEEMNAVQILGLAVAFTGVVR